MRKIISAVALAAALSFSVYAGEIQNGAPAPPPPPPPQPQSIEEATVAGDMLTPPLVELALTLFGLI